ncbi:hypothetical protein BBB39_09105 [Bordetella trematum]|uniref:Phage protein n=1 Tax=Bordetella trematum TaxID=123899 RepID=A0A157QAR1_9BORD|nr:hypothetical protein [Bordetella trematum]AZR93910.1 hypothetical protein BBB39_09105 [Bordetella trematum]NNH19041.1 hypothetical protein [Bordetella trematum]SAI42847.1 Uncharacterised protein [Bordetella trematum]SAI72182.1 Uncharacterised protein [Bordetella trematum]SUV97944.1 Uncharacterised protein [Bordetella trematum]
MTCYYTVTQWRDALYNAIRACDGGVDSAARFLSDRRDVSMHPESLRRKLRGRDHLDVDVAVLLAEFVSRDAGAANRSNEWLLSLCAQEGLHVDDVPPEPVGGHDNEARALQAKFMEMSAEIGKIASVTVQTTSDERIDQGEADTLIPLLRAARVLLHRMERNARRGALREQ